MNIDTYNDFLFRATDKALPTVVFIFTWSMFGMSAMFFGLAILQFIELAKMI